MNGSEGACWGSEGDLIAEQGGHCAAFNPACTPSPPLLLGLSVALPPSPGQGRQLFQEANFDKGSEQFNLEKNRRFTGLLSRP